MCTVYNSISYRVFFKILSVVKSVLKVWKILEVNNLFLIRIILAGHSETGQYINQNKHMAHQIGLRPALNMCIFSNVLSFYINKQQLQLVLVLEFYFVILA